jgi:hypothetical protein
MKEWKAKTVFHSYLDEISETCKGIFLAKEARTALYAHLNRDTLRYDGAAETLINSALGAVSKIEDGHVVRSLFMSAHAGFEQYLRSLFEAAALSISNAKLNKEKLNEDGMSRRAVLNELSGWQINLAGDAFGRYFEPLAHLTVDYAQVAKAIVQCGDAKEPFFIDGKVFGFRVGNIDQAAITRLFKRFGCTLLWDGLAVDAAVQKLLDKTNKVATEKEIVKIMAEALKTRNRIAHTQGEFGMGKEELFKQIKFLQYVSEFLFNALSAHVTKLIT